MPITQEQANLAKEYVNKLPKEQRDDFIKRYSSLSSSGKEEIIGRINSSNSTREDKSQIGMGDVLGVSALGAGVLGGGYLAGKGLGYLGKGLINAPKVLSSQKGASFADEVRKSFVQAHSDEVNKFGSELDRLSSENPKVKVDLRGVADELELNWKELPNEVKSVVKKTPIIREMVGVKKPRSTNVTLKESQDIINYINTKVPKNIKANSLDLIDMLNNIKASQLESFPGMVVARESYSKFIEPYKQVKQYFKFNKLLNAIENDFGGAEGKEAIKKVLPESVIKRMGGYKAATRVLNPLKPLLKSIFGIGGKALGVAMPIMQAYEMSKDPEAAQYNAVGLNIAPKGSMDREIQMGRLL